MVVGGKKKHPRQQSKKLISNIPKNPKNIIPDQIDLATFEENLSKEECNNINPFDNLPKLIIENPVTRGLEIDHLAANIETDKLQKLRDIEAGSCLNFGFFKEKEKDFSDRPVKSHGLRTGPFLGHFACVALALLLKGVFGGYMTLYDNFRHLG